MASTAASAPRPSGLRTRSRATHASWSVTSAASARPISRAPSTSSRPRSRRVARVAQGERIAEARVVAAADRLGGPLLVAAHVPCVEASSSAARIASVKPSDQSAPKARYVGHVHPAHDRVATEALGIGGLAGVHGRRAALPAAHPEQVEIDVAWARVVGAGRGEMERVPDETRIVAGRLPDDDVAHDDPIAGERGHHVAAVAGAKRRLREAVAGDARGGQREGGHGMDEPGGAHVDSVAAGMVWSSITPGQADRPRRVQRPGRPAGPMRASSLPCGACPSCDRSAPSGSTWPARTSRPSSARRTTSSTRPSVASSSSAIPHNAVRIELPADLGTADADAYRGAARTVAEWRSDGVLRKDREPSVTLHRMSWTTAGGEDAQATGVYARLRLEPYGAGVGCPAPRAHPRRSEGGPLRAPAGDGPQHEPDRRPGRHRRGDTKQRRAG